MPILNLADAENSDVFLSITNSLGKAANWILLKTEVSKAERIIMLKLTKIYKLLGGRPEEMHYHRDWTVPNNTPAITRWLLPESYFWPVFLDGAETEGVNIVGKTLYDFNEWYENKMLDKFTLEVAWNKIRYRFQLLEGDR